ncbi:MAG: tetratricopeptide repeat protein, partial [Nevskiales bacterium]|nr:tetratricopeptide repeat protein [Nevskiales bacterium]
LALIRSQQGRHAAAVQLIARAAGLAPKDWTLQHNHGEVLRRAGRPAEALLAYRRAVELAPNAAVAQYCLANALRAGGRNDEALPHYEEAVRLDPGLTAAQYNLGNTLLDLGRYRSASEAFLRVLALDPKHARALNNLGVCHRERGDQEKSGECFARALERAPDFDKARRNRAQYLEARDDIEGAREHYRRGGAGTAAVLDELRAATLCPVVFESRVAVEDYESRVEGVLREFLRRGVPLDFSTLHETGVCPSSLMTYHHYDVRPVKQAFAALFEGQFPRTVPDPPAGPPWRIGFVVTHGHEGVFLKCMRGVIRELSRERFQPILICSEPNGPAILRKELAGIEAEYLPLPKRIDEAAERILRGRFHLLYYWESGTDLSNYFLPFWRLAPVQCTGWGWPVTSGAPHMDGFISAEALEPSGAEAHYTERLIRSARLPTCYPSPPVAARARTRAERGLPERGSLYFCAQNLRKLHPDFDALARGVLERDPAGTLLISGEIQPALTRRLQQRLQKSCADVFERVRIVPRLAEAEYRERLRTADVVLDTPHYSGGANSNYDAFAAGTPVVTLPGAFHRGRYTLAAYRQMGVLDAVAESPEDYARIAVTLAREPDRRADLSRRLLAALPEVIEDRRAVRELETLFESAIRGAAAA